jgi:hypothetical protein
MRMPESDFLFRCYSDPLTTQEDPAVEANSGGVQLGPPCRSLLSDWLKRG